MKGCAVELKVSDWQMNARDIASASIELRQSHYGVTKLMSNVQMRRKTFFINAQKCRP